MTNDTYTVELANRKGYEQVINTARVFITVKSPGERFSQYNKIATEVRPGDTLPKVAKELRQSVAGEHRFITPAQMAWAVYIGVEDKTPYITSKNWAE